MTTAKQRKLAARRQRARELRRFQVEALGRVVASATAEFLKTKIPTVTRVLWPAVLELPALDHEPGAPEAKPTGGAQRLGKITSSVSVPSTGKDRTDGK